MTGGRARLARYAPWQARDFAVERGIPTLIVGALLLLLAVESTGGAPRATPLGGWGEDVARGALTGLLQAFAPTATLLAVNGIVSTDRTRQYFRLLFAKPVSVARYYAQAWLVSAVGLLACAALVLAAYAALVYPVWAPGALLFVALYFLLFGGIGLLLSAVTRYDWMALGLVWALAQLLRSLFPADESWYGRVLDVSLPPLHVLSAMGGALVRGEAVPPFSYVWVAAYGSAALLLGLIIVRRRPLAS